MDHLRHVVVFVLGAVELVLGVTGDAVQWDVVAIAIALMGLSGADEIHDLVEHHDAVDASVPPVAPGAPTASDPTPPDATPPDAMTPGGAP